MAMIRAFAGPMPVLGVCLGHQSIVAVFGGEIVRARAPDARQDSLIRARWRRRVRGSAESAGDRALPLARGGASKLPAVLEVTARTETGEIMGVRHRSLAVEGVQFHPESVLTPEGPN